MINSFLVLPRSVSIEKLGDLAAARQEVIGEPWLRGRWRWFG
jgi:hypothetical protein